MKIKLIIFLLFLTYHVIAQSPLPVIEDKGAIANKEERAIEQYQKLLRFKGNIFFFSSSYKTGKICSLPSNVNPNKEKAILKYGRKMLSEPSDTIPSSGYHFRLANIYCDKEYVRGYALGFYMYILLLLEDTDTGNFYLNRIDLNKMDYYFYGVYPYDDKGITIGDFSDKIFYAFSKTLIDKNTKKYFPEYCLKMNNIRLKGAITEDNRNYIVFSDGARDYLASYQDISSSGMIEIALCKYPRYQSDYCYLELKDKAIARLKRYAEEEKTFYAQIEVQKREGEQNEIERRKKVEIENQKAIANWEKSQDERKQGLIKKYGKRVTNMILNNEVQIGWNKDMCVESWGMPENINYTKFANYVQEQWVYSIDTYLYFTNGKLTAIQKSAW